MYVSRMSSGTSLRAWHPAVPGVREVLHARMTDHAYPAHAHADWTLLLVDEGAVAYELGGRARIADATRATLLPPGVAHDGRAAAGSAGFRKRVVYLEASWMPEAAASALVDRPGRADLLSLTRRLHRALALPGSGLAAEGMLLALAERFRLGAGETPSGPRDDALARRLRALLEDRLVEGVTLAEAARLLDADPGRLARVFRASFGLPPHRYVTGRRVDVARRLLLDGRSPAAVAPAAGFYDQAHLTRHFRSVLGSTPARFARANGAPDPRPA